MPTLDFALARSKHLDWKIRLGSLLNGRSTMSEAEAESHKHCQLGRWLYSEGLEKYGHKPSMRELEQTHAELHSLVRRILKMKTSGDVKGAEHEFERVARMSNELTGLLTQVEQEVTG